jgi:hypothetical protein
LPGPIALQPPRQTVVGDGFQRLSQGHTTGRRPVIQSCGEVEPTQLWHRVLSFTEVGRELYSTSPPLRNLSQPLNLSGQQPHAFSRVTPTPLWADLLPEARVAPVSGGHLGTTAAYDPTEAHAAWTTAELRLQPLSCWTLSLAPEFHDASHLERVTGGMRFTLSAAWSVPDAIGSQTFDFPAASHTVTTRYRSPYGHARLHLAQSPEETTVGVLIDVVTLLRRTLGF